MACRSKSNFGSASDADYRLERFLLAIFTMNLMAVPAPADSKPAEPSAEQLAAAKEAYAKFGGQYGAVANPKTNQTIHLFRMRDTTTDADLKGLPDLPFPFLSTSFKPRLRTLE